MTPILSLPLPFDAWHVYRDHVKRFCDTFKQFPPGCDYEVWAVCNWGEPTDEVREWFYGIKTRFIPYFESGCDLGGHQHIPQLLAFPDEKERMIIGFTSRCYFHRTGWLKRLMLVRETIGASLIGCSASKQGGKIHVCTRAFALSVWDWMKYPLDINSRQRGPLFEVGADNPNGNLMEWFNRERENRSVVVHWDDVFQLPHEWERYVASKGRFRDGEQNAMLVHDFHTDLYRDASPEKKVEMEMQLRGAP